MAEQAWFPSNGTGFDGSSNGSGNGSGNGFAPPPPAPMVQAKSRYELRPLTTGELLDRTFHLYRSNFWMFVGLASIAAAVRTLAGLVQILYLHFGGPSVGRHPVAPGNVALAIFQTLPVFALSMISSVFYLAIYSVVQAATTAAVTAIYLGDETSMRMALKSVKGRWWRFIGIGFWQMWSSVWFVFVAILAAVGVMVVVRLAHGVIAPFLVGLATILAILGGSVFGLVSYIRNSFAVPAAVMEDLKVRKAMRRSKVLIEGSKWRVFLLFVFILVLYFVAVAIQSPISFLILQKKTTQLLLMQAISLFIGFLTGSVIGPVGAIGVCLFYIDQRIRKEGFDIEFLIERSGDGFVAPVVAELAVEPESL